MTPTHWNVLLVYAGFTLVATLLALARRWLRPDGGGESVWSKYPTFILINLCFLAAGWSPPAWHVLTMLLALLGALASWELSQVLLRPQPSRSYLIPAITFLLILSAGFWGVTLWLRIWLAVVLITIAAATVIGNPDQYPWLALALAGCVLYLPLCLAAYQWIQRGDPSGFHNAFLYLVIAANDALAQITGQLFGRRQLSPRVSPAKTVEGALGGLLFACAMGAALSGSSGFNLRNGAVIGLVLGAAGLIGDLTASMWKRALGIKNYSTLLGAQGGALDRFDGLIFAAPVYYLMLTIAF